MENKHKKGHGHDEKEHKHDAPVDGGVQAQDDGGFTHDPGDNGNPHDCPQGQVWDEELGRCIDDIG